MAGYLMHPAIISILDAVRTKCGWLPPDRMAPVCFVRLY